MKERELERPKAYDTLPKWVKDPLQNLAVRAILLQVQKTGLPKSFLIDLAQDIQLIGDYQIDRFVFCLRECGTQMFAPLTLDGVRQSNSFEAHCNVFDKDRSCKWFTFDVRDVRRGEEDPVTGKRVYDDYNQPQLRSCTQEQAREYLEMLYREDQEEYNRSRHETKL